MFSLSRRSSDGLRQSCWRRFRRDRRGAAAVEFAIVVMPFFAVVGLIMETSFQAYSLASLDDALRRGSRGLQLGTLQAGGKDVDAFKQDVCRLLQSWMTCNNLVVDVRPVARYDDLDINAKGPGGTHIGRTSPLKPQQAGNTYCPGRAGDVMVVRANYKIPTIFGYWVTSPVGDHYVISSAHTFRTEPFTFNYSPPAGCSAFD
jgi:Flp pilus assembly protein TadG